MEEIVLHGLSIEDVPAFRTALRERLTELALEPSRGNSTAGTAARRTGTPVAAGPRADTGGAGRRLGVDGGHAMSEFPGSPRLVKGGIVLVDPDTGALLQVISLQYNPDTLTRTRPGARPPVPTSTTSRRRCASRGYRSRRSSWRPRSTPPTSWSSPTRTRPRCGTASTRSSPCWRRWRTRAAPTS